MSLALLKFQVDHTDFLLLLSDFNLAILKDVLLNIGLLIENTKFVISIDQSDSHVVTGLTSLLVSVDQVVHLRLKGVNDQVELISLVDVLSNNRLLLSELELEVVELVL